MDKNWIGCASSNFRQGRRAPYRPEAIVIHIMAGSLRGTDVWFHNAGAGVSAHYGIGKNGEVHQYVQEEDTASHAGIVDQPSWPLIKPMPGGVYVNPNFYTIGIEHEGFPDDTWPAAQVTASASLIAEIAGRWVIPLDRQHVIKHHEIRYAKPCPGDQAPMDQLIQEAQHRLAAPVSAPAQVTALSNLNVRAGAPNQAAQVRRVAPAGTVLDVAGYTASGQPVRGNACWYRDAAGDFFWAGATDRPNPTAA
jgi:N-acetylmuramoyl-L-alanine amidase